MSSDKASTQQSTAPASSSSTSSPPDTSIIEKQTTMVSDLHVHAEHHVGHSELIRNGIIGFSDGLTVPFALCAGLSSLNDQRIVVIGGLAELFAGAISMGLGAYLAASTSRKHFDAEEQRERREVLERPGDEEEEIFEILGKYGVPREQAGGVVMALKQNEEMWVKFMMDFELRLERPEKKAALFEGLVMAAAYFVGGLLPMIPYFIFRRNVNDALFVSIGITGLVLLAFGYIKAKIIGISRRACVMSALQALLIGTLAAGAAYGVVRAVNAGDVL